MALAHHLLIGTLPVYRVDAVHEQRDKTWTGRFHISFHHLEEEQLQSFIVTPLGVRIATAEKAVLDSLYFVMRGKKYPFDIYKDINRGSLNETKFFQILKGYRNPRFITFAKK